MSEIIKTLFKEKQIKSLDGLRAIACMAVIIAHLADKHTLSLTPFLKEYLEIGKEGVALFFTISGFIITHLLYKEKTRTKEINIAKFYFRRMIKIIPVLYCYLLFLVIVNVPLKLALSFDGLLSCFLFYKNYSFSEYSVYTGHIWSLANEEHFYLIWPWIVLYFNKKSINYLAILIVLASPLIRVATYLFFPSLHRLIDIMSHCRLDSFMIGCLIAINYEYLLEKIKNIETRKMHLWGAGILVLYFFILPYYKFHAFKGYWFLLGIFLNAFLSGMILIALTRDGDSLVYRLFNNVIIRHIGIISYSMYIWQEFFTYHLESAVLAIVSSYLTALISFVLIEYNFEKIKNKYG